MLLENSRVAADDDDLIERRTREQTHADSTNEDAAEANYQHRLRVVLEGVLGLIDCLLQLRGQRYLVFMFHEYLFLTMGVSETKRETHCSWMSGTKG